MATQKPLKDMIPELIEHFNRYADNLDFNYRIFKILNGQLKNEVECSLRKEILSKSALCRALQRIPSINIMKKVTDKLSKVYIDTPIRLTDKESDQEIMENIHSSSQIDSIFTEANKLYNAAWSFAIEPYVENRKHKLRVLAPHQFLPYSDSIVNPTEMTVFMKFLGKKVDNVGPEFDENGNKIREESSREVDVIAVYSDDEFFIMDNLGSIRFDLMLKMGITNTKNPYGKIPFIYKSKSKLQLISYPNQEGLDMSILIPKLLTDLNYAAQFMSHSIIYIRDTDLSDQVLNPDTVIDLGSSDEDGNSPKIGTIDPKVDISENLKLIEFQVQSYFDGLGIKTKSSINNSGNAESGISKSIDEGDTTAEKKVQTEFFRCVEQELAALLFETQRVWSSNNLVEENRMFSESFDKSFRIQFSEMKTAKSDRQKLDEISLWRDQGLMSKKQAIRTLRPEYTDKQVDAHVAEIEAEEKENLEKGLMGLPDFGADKSTTNGQFVEGNSAAKNDPTDRSNREEDKLNG